MIAFPRLLRGDVESLCSPAAGALRDDSRARPLLRGARALPPGARRRARGVVAEGLVRLGQALDAA